MGTRENTNRVEDMILNMSAGKGNDSLINAGKVNPSHKKKMVYRWDKKKKKFLKLWTGEGEYVPTNEAGKKINRKKIKDGALYAKWMKKNATGIVMDNSDSGNENDMPKRR